MDKATTGEDPADLIATLQEECAYLHECNRLERIEAKAWMREVIASYVEANQGAELAEAIRKIPTEAE